MSTTGNPDAGNSLDYALIMDMMEYFCFAIKPTRFSGCMTFVFYHEAGSGPVDGKEQKETEFEVTVTIEKVDAASDKPPGEKDPQRPRVVVTLGGPPEGALYEAKGRARVSYEQFLLVYSGKASAKDIISMALKRKIQLSGFASSMKFGFSFEYSKPTWTAYYSAKARESLREDDEAADQSYFETLEGMSPRSSPRRNCRGEKETVGQEVLGLEGRAREEGRGAVAEASVNRVLFSSDRFRTVGKSRKLKRQENAVDKEDGTAVISRGAGAKDRDEDDDAGSDGQSGGSDFSGDGACGGGGRRAKRWVHMSLASWIWRLNEVETSRGTCYHSSRNDVAEPAFGWARGCLDPSLASWLPILKNTLINTGVFLLRIGAGVKRRRSCISVERCCQHGCYRDCCVQQRNQPYPSAFLRRYTRLQFDPSHSVGRAVLCPRRDSYGLVYSPPQLRQLASPFTRAVNGKRTPDGALMSLIIAKPTNAFHSSWRDSSSSRLLQRDSAKGSFGDVSGGSDKGGWVENRTSLAAVAGGATAGTMLFLRLFGGRGCGVGADKLRGRLPQLLL